MNLVLLLKVLLFTVLVPGTVVGYIPYRILTARGGEIRMPAGSFLGLALPIIVVGAALYLRCAWDFAVTGSGTPAPIDPPKHLVIKGIYRYTRNPMYLGVLLVLVGESWLFWSCAVLVYAGLVFVFFHLFVVLYEERSLRAKFGEPYEKYRRAVPRWFIRLRAYEPRDGAA